MDAVLDRLSALGRSSLDLVPTLVVAVVLIGMFWVIKTVLKRLVMAGARRARRPSDTVSLLGRLTAAAVMTIGVIATATALVPGVTLASLFGALGIGTVAIGFAFKDILQNLLAGLLILLTRPFRIGDQIVTGEHEGTVEEIQVRATVLSTYDNRRVVIPNGDLYTDRVVVNTAHPARRLELPVSVGDAVNIPAVKDLLLAAVAPLEEVLTEPAPVVLVRDLGDDEVALEVRVWLQPPRRRDLNTVRDRVLCAVHAALREHEVPAPAPTRRIVGAVAPD